MKKYAPICDAIGSKFIAGVVERFGACCEDLTGFLKLISGDGDRDPLCDDYTFSSRSNTTYVAQMVVFATVIADACMLSDVIDCDVVRDPADLRRRQGRYGAPRGRRRGPPRPRARPGVRAAPRQHVNVWWGVVSAVPDG